MEITTKEKLKKRLTPFNQNASFPEDYLLIDWDILATEVDKIIKRVKNG